ncbi:DUF6894 family protein [Rhizobium aethiopicum]|uniref:DUF6894 family protein n=1 Tax=Rhizobium aethiopicum TaxID=1138170 RepID=UPI003CC987A8
MGCPLLLCARTSNLRVQPPPATLRFGDKSRGGHKKPAERRETIADGECEPLPTYYFHIRHADRVLHDPDGGDFPDLEAARHEASESLRELLDHTLLSKRSSVPLGIDIYDGDGKPVAEVEIDAVVPEITPRKPP